MEHIIFGKLRIETGGVDRIGKINWGGGVPGKTMSPLFMSSGLNYSSWCIHNLAQCPSNADYGQLPKLSCLSICDQLY